MQVNMLEAKNQLSRLVKAAQAGEEVIKTAPGPMLWLAPMELEPFAQQPIRVVLNAGAVFIGVPS